MRGLPGSGKSSFVSKFLKNQKESSVHAIDDLHTNDDGNFVWDEDNAERNYELNYANFVVSCSKNKDIVVCDCMNLATREVQRYVNIAEQFGYCVYVVTANPQSTRELTRRNKHNISSVLMRELMSRWEHWPTSPMLEKLSKE
jgi:predicted kinase